MLNTTIIPAPRVPLVDPETGIISNEWYRYLFNLFTLTGAGGNAVSLDDLQIGPPVQESIVTGGGGGSVNSVTGSAPISSTGGANPDISISQATTSTNGYLSSTDWNTFNSKGSGTVTSVTGTSPVTSSGGTAPAISLAAAYGDTLNPYASKTANYVLASPDGLAGVPTFRAVVANDIPTLNQNTTGSAATLTTGRTIAITGDLAYTSPSFNGSTNVTAAGTLATVNTNVGSFTNASLTVNGKGLITAASSGTAPVTSVTGTTPVVSSGGTTPAISMPAATTTVSGYLTSTDWNTFNGKSNTNGTVTSVAALTLGTTGTDLSSTVATGTTTPVITLQVPTASATNRGALSAADWTTFNNKGSGTVTSVTGTSPVVSSGGTTPAISMPAATTSVNGYLTSTDWNTFNGKGSGTVTSITAGTGLSGGTITTSGTIAIDSTVATLTGTQTLTNKTLTSPTLTTATTSGKFTFGGAIDETVYAVIDAAGVALSPSNGTIQTWTLGASRTPTAGTWDAGESITMMINDGTAYTITWTTLGVVWVGGSAPTLATTGFTVIELWKVGTTIYGALVGSVA